jgi:hypothetical protein
MPQKVRTLTLLSFSMIAIAGSATFMRAAKPAAAVISNERVDVSALWRDPADIASRSLYFGAGGEADQPHEPYTFVEEDMDGSNPKYVVRDRDNVKWTVKIGMEARPENAATRLVWAAGYFTNEDYFLPVMQIEGMPAKVKRGQKMIGPGGTLTNARLKRHLSDEKNVGNWEWDGTFAGTRELNGLKVMMALINNWDLKDVNNKIYSEKGSKDQIYMVSDLGASFGAAGLSFPFKRSKDNLEQYEKSKFVLRMTPQAIDFATPHHPSWEYADYPRSFIRRTHLDNIVHNIPREDARWIGEVLSKLSNDQIRDAFRASGYSDAEVDGFSGVVEGRIAQLKTL